MNYLIKDLPIVKVKVYGDNFNRAIHAFQKRVAKAGILNDLKIRRGCCTKAERKKIKKRKVEERRKKYLRIQQARAYDTDNRDALH